MALLVRVRALVLVLGPELVLGLVLGLAPDHHRPQIIAL